MAFDAGSIEATLVLDRSPFKQGLLAAERYRRSFEPCAVERCLQEHPGHIVELGPSEVVHDEPELHQQLARALAPHPVFLLLPESHPLAGRDEVAALLGDAPRRRDLLIEFLHLIQDRYHCLSAAHLAALAAELKMALAEVYEVATFYHHFDVVKEGETSPPPLTIRVCASLSCAMAGAERLIGDLARRVDPAAGRILRAPCVGRGASAPVVRVYDSRRGWGGVGVRGEDGRVHPKRVVRTRSEGA